MTPETSRVQELGGLAEDFTLPGVNGGQANLAALLAGKKGAVVVFWSGVCSHCIRYDAYLDRFAAQYPDLSLVVIASRSGETPVQIRNTMADRGIRFPIFHDQGGAVARQWSTEQTPRAFLVDAGRVVLYRGAVDNFKYPGDPEYVAYLDNAISDFLAGKPVRRAETASFGCAIRSVYYTLPKHF
ncbi:MAG TPA: redoxin family protein [Bryobacteraceae bacterium]|jgi:peroxiredoxin|nr:redoxin family protein [Bryobacteraceae bacterium]